MISVNQAKDILKATVSTGEIKHLPLSKTLDLIAAEDIFSPIEVPSFDNSAMDGYAITWEDNLDTWEITDVIAAGNGKQHQLQYGKAGRIFTGAPLPKGSDTVIPQEFVHREGNLIRIIDKGKFQKGSNVRFKGAQTKTGEVILKKGSQITPGTIGLLASVGISEVPVFSPPKVAIIITGNELQELGNPLAFGQIYNSNGPVLESYLKKLGIQDILSYQAEDEPKATQKIIEEALAKADLVLLTGGISVGDYDFVKNGLENAGVKELFYKIRQKPGKPLFAGKKGRQMVFALPGNPASVITCFNQYVRPSLLQWLGHTSSWSAHEVLPIANDFIRNAGLTFFLKAKVEHGVVHILNGQESFNLISFGSANCLAEIPEEIEQLKAGEKIAVYYW